MCTSPFSLTGLKCLHLQVRDLVYLAHGLKGLVPGWLVPRNMAWWKGLGRGQLLTLWQPGNRERGQEKPGVRMHPSRSCLQWPPSIGSRLLTAHLVMNTSMESLPWFNHLSKISPLKSWDFIWDISDLYQNSMYRRKHSTHRVGRHCGFEHSKTRLLPLGWMVRKWKQHAPHLLPNLKIPPGRFWASLACRKVHFSWYPQRFT